MTFDLSFLNKEQRQAVEQTDGHLLILAGAGTGKTRVLTARIAYIISNSLADIDQILAVTFTNKAANEMRERTVSMLKLQNSGLFWIGTFHSLCLRIIRPHFEKINRSRNFTILDSEDQIRIIKKIQKEQNFDDKKYPPKTIAFYINRWKDQLKSYDDAKQGTSTFVVEDIALKIYRLYEDILKSLDAIDFGDIIFYCVNIFKKHEDILKYYQNKFKYIMVDEYQDTNAAQYVLLRLLSMGHGNICCVGDDDQSIYSWRGAEVGNILRFEKDFKGARVIRLEQNYRSTQNILNTANKLISNNSDRMNKNLWTDEEGGLPVIVKPLGDPFEEAAFVASLIENKKKNGTGYNEVAILVRAAFQTRAFEEKLLAFKIPYNIIGGLRFYERKEIKDAIAYLRLVLNPDDGIAFERIVNLPRRGIGPGAIAKFYDTAREYGISLPKAAENIGMPKLIPFFEMLNKWRDDLTIITPQELMSRILEESGYTSMLKEKNDIEDETKLETLKELVSALGDFDDAHQFIEYVSLILDNAGNNMTEQVTISTIHAAKGLEYKTVFIPGFEENIIPNQKALEEKGVNGLEEERRLCYVALTRAKKEAYITLCNRRNTFFGASRGWQYAKPSRFLQDLPNGSVRVLK